MRLSIGKKMALLLVVLSVMLGTAVLAVGDYVLWRMSIGQYTTKADEVSAAAALMVDVENARKLRDAVHEVYRVTEEKVSSADWGSQAFYDYVSRYTHLEQTPEYQQQLAELRRMQDVCSVFEHSPVFRIGGDEFAIVLEHGDYERIEELVDEFSAVLDAQRQAADSDLEPWECVSVALGYALFDPAIDTDVESVFRRADKAMYERKRETKDAAAIR